MARRLTVAASVLILVPLLQLVPGSAAGRAYVRVNQVGYVQDRTKQAFLLSDTDHEGEPFDLVGDGDVVVFSGTIGIDRGPWNSRFGYVNQIDFDVFADPGVFVLKAAGAVSPSFRVGSGADVYTPLLHNALFYFLAQRDGADVDPTVLEREPSHLNDAHARVYETPEYHNGSLAHDLVPTGDRADVEGGWFDAGDYIKLTHTTAFVLTVMQQALRDDPSLFADGGPDFAGEAKFGLDWLLKQWDGTRRIVYSQVGMGNTGLGYLSDHDVWRLPEVDDGLTGRENRYLAHRPVFRVGPPGSLVPPSIAGRMAAAFGLCSQIFRSTDQALADRCLRAGEGVFDLAKTKHTTNHTTAPSGYYPEGPMWRDDLELGAIELHLALRDAVSVPGGLAHPDPAFYLEWAAHWANAYLRQPDDQHDTFNLYDVSGLAHPELYRAIVGAGNPSLPVTANEVLGGLRRQLDTAASIAAADPFGYGWLPGDPSPHTFGLVAEATWYDQITGTDRYASLVDAEVDWSLGANAWGTTFVIGAGSRFPECPQHQVANLVGSLDGTGDVLLGGAVDGPSDYIPTGFFGPNQAPPCPPDGKNPFRPFDQADWRYVDRVASWATTEPANDYSSLAFLAFVQLAAQT
jgi:endoglucanase